MIDRIKSILESAVVMNIPISWWVVHQSFNRKNAMQTQGPEKGSIQVHSKWGWDLYGDIDYLSTDLDPLWSLWLTG